MLPLHKILETKGEAPLREKLIHAILLHGGIGAIISSLTLLVFAVIEARFREGSCKVAFVPLLGGALVGGFCILLASFYRKMSTPNSWPHHSNHEWLGTAINIQIFVASLVYISFWGNNASLIGECSLVSYAGPIGLVTLGAAITMQIFSGKRTESSGLNPPQRP